MHVYVILFKKKNGNTLVCYHFCLSGYLLAFQVLGLQLLGIWVCGSVFFGVWGLGSVPLVISKNKLTTKRFYIVQIN